MYTCLYIHTHIYSCIMLEAWCDSLYLKNWKDYMNAKLSKGWTVLDFAMSSLELRLIKFVIERTKGYNKAEMKAPFSKGDHGIWLSGFAKVASNFLWSSRHSFTEHHSLSCFHNYVTFNYYIKPLIPGILDYQPHQIQTDILSKICIVVYQCFIFSSELIYLIFHYYYLNISLKILKKYKGRNTKIIWPMCPPHPIFWANPC